MRILRGLHISARQIGTHRTRTALALLGIVIGVSSVITMVAVGHGARQEVIARIEAMGTDLIMVTPAQIRPSSGRREVRGSVTTLTPEDAESLTEGLSPVEDAAAWVGRRLPVKYGGISSTTTVQGIAPSAQEVLRLSVARGAFFSEREDLTGARTAVLGPAVARTLFGQEPAVGRRILVGRVPFEVVGVLAARGTDISGTDQDDLVMIPLTTALRRVLNQHWLDGIYLKARSGADLEQIAEEVGWLLRERHRLERTGAPDDFEIQTQTELVEAHREIGDTFTALVGGIAAVSLLVGGIGILAIMLMSVRERTREIGLRLAVGARRRDVRLQFLAEAVMLGTGGGLAGVLAGLAAAAAVGSFTQWAVSVEPFSVVAPFGFSLLVGVFFGSYPAHRASLLDPVEALQKE